MGNASLSGDKFVTLSICKNRRMIIRFYLIRFRVSWIVAVVHTIHSKNKLIIFQDKKYIKMRKTRSICISLLRLFDPDFESVRFPNVSGSMHMNYPLTQ